MGWHKFDIRKHFGDGVANDFLTSLLSMRHRYEADGVWDDGAESMLRDVMDVLCCDEVDIAYVTGDIDALRDLARRHADLPGVPPHIAAIFRVAIYQAQCHAESQFRDGLIDHDGKQRVHGLMSEARAWLDSVSAKGDADESL